jgi:hypothetical protein
MWFFGEVQYLLQLPHAHSTRCYNGKSVILKKLFANFLEYNSEYIFLSYNRRKEAVPTYRHQNY